MRDSDIAFHLRRAAQELAAAAAAGDPAIRRIDLKLADHHRARAQTLSNTRAVARAVPKPSVHTKHLRRVILNCWRDRMVSVAADPQLIARSDIARAIAIGLIAGIAAASAMDAFQAGVATLSESEDDAEPATDRAANGIVRTVTGRDLSASAKPLGGHIVHYTLGAGLGALYGAAAAYRRDVAVGYGTAFGVGVAAVLDNAAVPAAGLGDPPWETGPATHAYSLVSHLVFGAALELARRGLDTIVPGKRLA